MPGSLIIDLEGTQLQHEERELLTHPAVAGVILFSRNFLSKDQVTQLNYDIKSVNEDLLICVDQEGGNVQRFKEGFTILPAAAMHGAIYDERPEAGLNEAYKYGKIMARELLEVGVDFSFAPVLDVDHDVSDVIGERSFHDDPHVVTKLASASIDGIKSTGMAVVGKHFPGHGGVAADTHTGVVVDDRSFETLSTHEMIPFIELLPKLDAMMPAHVIYEKVDKRPASLSSRWLKNILRDQYGYQGIVISDDFSMEAAKAFGSASECVNHALLSGCDLVLVCNDRQAVHATLDNAPLAPRVFDELKPRTNRN